MNTYTSFVCTECGETHNDHEPDLDPRDKESLLCSSCWLEITHFACGRCGEYELLENQHRYVVVREEVGEIPRGVYRIKERNYYTHALIGAGWFNNRAIELVGRPTERCTDEAEWFPCHHLCRSCAAPYENAAVIVPPLYSAMAMVPSLNGGEQPDHQVFYAWSDEEASTRADQGYGYGRTIVRCTPALISPSVAIPA